MENSKVVTYGNKNSRYAVILIKRNSEGKCIDNTISYYYDDDFDSVQFIYDSLQRCQDSHIERETGIILDIDVYDYQQTKYITHLVRGY